jgi:hypothetical protein
MKNLFLFLVILSSACQETIAQTKIKTGTWRGILKPAAGGELPFNFIVKDTAGKQQLTIFNAHERFKVTDIKTQADSVFIRMPLFDSEFRLQAQGVKLTGQFIKHLGERDAVTPFNATYGQNWRFFETPEKPAYNITGRWSAVFGEGTERDTTVGEFKQTGSKVTGTFLTTTGDYRYLEGSVSGS